MNDNLTQYIEDIIKKHEVALCRYCHGILKDREQAKDIVQESFMKLIKELTKGQRIENEKAWLYRVCHNLALDYLRKIKRNNERIEEVQDMVSNTNTISRPDSALVSKESHEYVWNSLKLLSEREQKIIELKMKNNYSYQQIADELQLTSTNVGFILHQALKKLAVNFKMQENNEVNS